MKDREKFDSEKRKSATRKNEELDEALKESFPASDPPESTQPGVTGWDLTEEEKKKLKRK
jgi:hypothetical protein